MKAITRSRAFTLIEMLTVIVIIGILVGILFKMMANADRARQRAACATIIERVAFALNEFKAEYGQYPPGDGGTKNWYPGWMPDLLKTNYFGKYESTPEMIYNYCYLSYLIDRVSDPSLSVNKQQIPDSERDTAAKKRWAKFLSGLVSGGTVTNFYAINKNYHLNYQTIPDPWGNELQYKCTPPYQIYDLYSVGPDGQEGVVNGKCDDMHSKQKWDD